MEISIQSIVQIILFMYYYINNIISEYVQYYYIYLLLKLPAWLLNKEIIIYDSDDDSQILWFTSIRLIMKEADNVYYIVHISGQQLILFADKYGKIPFYKLLNFYPKLDTLYIQYLNLNKLNYMSDEEIIKGPISPPKLLDLSNGITTKIFDIKKKIDIRSGQKCKFSCIQI